MGEQANPTPLSPEEEPLAGTVKPYRRHLALCTGGPPELWLARIEEMEGIASRLHQILWERGLTKRIKVTACDEPTLEAEGVDILLLPEMRRLRGVTEGTAEALIDRLEAGQTDDLPCAVQEMAPGQHIFVCVHQNRDERCGRWGPLFHGALVEAIGKRGSRADVYRTSHIGGHRLAAVCIVYPEGVWYGRLRPEDAPRLVEQHLQGGRLLVEHYRGRINSSACRQVAEAEAARILSRTHPDYRTVEVAVEETDQQATAVARALVPTTAGEQVATATFSLSCPRVRWTVDDEPVFIVNETGDKE